MPGQIGLEATPEEYTGRMVDVFAELWRVLRADGVLWLNLGDCYATGAGKVGDHPGGEQGARWRGDASRVRDSRRRDRAAVMPNRGVHRADDAGKQSGRVAAMGPLTQPNRMPLAGLKPKDLVGVPWRVAFALQAAGWWLRSDIIWHKPNAMPESVTDRPTKAHEYLFLLTRSERYYYDADAIAEPRVTTGDAFVAGWATGPGSHAAVDHARENGGGAKFTHNQATPDAASDATTRNRRTVWTIASEAFAEAHFATFPTALAEPCILAGSRPGDVVLDPFCGAGTVGLVCERLGRSFVGIELNPEYAAMAEQRIRGDCPLFSDVRIVTGGGA
jgi:DNA modification methylase